MRVKRTGLNIRLGKALRGRSRGFSLIEVVIAIALLGIIGITILSALSTATLALIIADNRATAESLARTQMEYVQNKGYIDYHQSDHLEYGVIGEPDNYDIQMTVTPLDPQTYEPYLCNEETGLCANDEGIQLITVTITYYTLRADNAPREQTYTLEDYKIDEGVGE
jgi:prepilin-type N-terminal cleavage/methylation domain-containing protein